MPARYHDICKYLLHDLPISICSRTGGLQSDQYAFLTHLSERGCNDSRQECSTVLSLSPHADNPESDVIVHRLLPQERNVLNSSTQDASISVTNLLRRPIHKFYQTSQPSHRRQDKSVTPVAQHLKVTKTS